MVFTGAIWTLTTAVAEVTVVADLAASGNFAQFEAWWSFAEGSGNGFAVFAVAVAFIARNEAGDSQPLVPKWSSVVGVAAGLASFAGWAHGVWFDVGPASLLWVVASGVMCLWLAWLGLALAGKGERAGWNATGAGGMRWRRPFATVGERRQRPKAAPADRRLGR